MDVSPFLAVLPIVLLPLVFFFITGTRRSHGDGRRSLPPSPPGCFPLLGHLPLPGSVPHETTEDTELLGYHVPERTRVAVNAWAIARDPATWERAEEFLPERWLVAPAAAGNDFTFLPFGGGRRGCPGAGFGMASLLFHFDWELPAGGASTVDMDKDELGGLAMRLKKPLRLVAKPWSA